MGQYRHLCRPLLHVLLLYKIDVSKDVRRKFPQKSRKSNKKVFLIIKKNLSCSLLSNDETQIFLRCMYNFFRLYKAAEASQDVLKGPRAKCKQTVSNKHSTQSSHSLKLNHLLKDQMWDDFKGTEKLTLYFSP